MYDLDVGTSMLERCIKIDIKSLVRRQQQILSCDIRRTSYLHATAQLYQLVATFQVQRQSRPSLLRVYYGN